VISVRSSIRIGDSVSFISCYDRYSTNSTIVVSFSK